MKLKTLYEARYSGPKSLENFLQFFEEEPHEMMEHRNWFIRPGFVAKANIVGDVEVDVLGIEQRQSEYYIRPTTVPMDAVIELKVYELVRRY